MGGNVEFGIKGLKIDFGGIMLEQDDSIADTKGDIYFTVNDAGCVVEANKTIGTGSITPIKHRDMLTTAITIGDEFYASDGVIKAAYDDLATGDKLYRDVTVIHSGTAPNGLGVTITLRDT